MDAVTAYVMRPAVEALARELGAEAARHVIANALCSVDATDPCSPDVRTAIARRLRELPCSGVVAPTLSEDDIHRLATRATVALERVSKLFG